MFCSATAVRAAWRTTWRPILCGLLLLLHCAAQAAVSLAVTPSGLQPANRSVRIVLTARYEAGAVLEDFSLRYNGVDVTSVFVQHAKIERPDARTLVATFDALLPPGPHSLRARLLMSREAPIVTETTFQVPEDEQDRLRTALLTRLEEFLRQYDGYAFSRASSLGDPSLFAAGTRDPSFQIYVDPDYLRSYNTQAEYVEWYAFGLSYLRDLVLAHDPQDYSLTRQPQTDYSPFILWEEMVHALSDQATRNGTPARLPDPGPPPGLSSSAIDHFYLDWAENCVTLGMPPLKGFEDYVRRNGSATPSDAVIKEAREYWRSFVNRCNASTNKLGVPDSAQRAAFKRLVGFDVDADTIRRRYLALGYPQAYFDAATVSIVSPGATSSVGTEEVLVTARASLVQGTRIDKMGFVVNGAVHYAGGSADSFSARVPLNPGPNTIHAGVLVLAATGAPAEAVLSAPITVTRTLPTRVCPQITTWTNTDQNLYAPLRVTRVDRDNSPGPHYFYIWANPNDPQEKAIHNTYFGLSAGPALTREMTFANNIGVSAISFASAADAETVWQRELAAFDALPPAGRPEVLMRDPELLIWGWTAFDGTRHIASLSRHHASVIAYHSARSVAAGETVAQAGLGALSQRMSTTIGLIDVKCGGR